LGIPRSVSYAWKRRESLVDKVGTGCRLYELLPQERSAICEFALDYPKIGYRKLTWMMVDAGRVCVGESTVYRVLSDADLLSRWKRSATSSGEYNFRPVAPNQQWHTDVMYVWVAARFYFLVSFVDAYSRYVVHHKLLISLDGKSVAIELQAALETVEGDKPRIVHEARVELLEEENRWLKAQLLGRSSEKTPAEQLNPDQAWLFNEAEALAQRRPHCSHTSSRRSSSMVCRCIARRASSSGWAWGSVGRRWQAG